VQLGGDVQANARTVSFIHFTFRCNNLPSRIICPLRMRHMPLTRRPMPSKRREEVVVEAGYIAKVAQALKDLLLLLYPHLVSRQMQSRRFIGMMIIWL
jgi:hypothetical protein